VTILRVKGFKVFKDRLGVMRCYHRKTGTPVDLRKTPLGSAEFIAECARIGGLGQKVVETPGTLGPLLHDYRASPFFLDLAPRTQADYQRVFDWLGPITDTPLKHWNRPLVVKIRDKAATSKGRRFGNYVKAVLSIVFTWGRERGIVADNHAAGVKDIRRPRGASEPNRAWSDIERQVVLDEASAIGCVAPGVGLDDVRRLGAERCPGAAAQLHTQWRDRHPAQQDGRAGFLANPGPAGGHPRSCATSNMAMTLCAHSGGRPWSQGGFSASWSLLRRRLEREGRIGPGLTLYGLRHTVAVILRESGCDERTIADALGQKTIEMAR
jgi:hypothetical protein